MSPRDPENFPGEDLAGAGTPVGEPTSTAPRVDGRDDLGGAGTPSGEPRTGEPGGGPVTPAGRPPHGRFRHAVARLALNVYYWGIRSPRKAKADHAEYVRVLTLTVAYQAEWAARHGIDFRTFVPEVYAALDEIEGTAK